MSKRKRPSYIRAGILSLDILPSLKDVRNPRQYKVLEGVKVKVSSQRYPVFQRSLKCVSCGIEGHHLAIERAGRYSEINDLYHLNLYAVKDGVEILMTKDHIIPKSKGGSDEQSNFQTMCTKCNGRKGNKLPEDLMKITN